jgi:hypothetical protein
MQQAQCQTTIRTVSRYKLVVGLSLLQRAERMAQSVSRLALCAML